MVRQVLRVPRSRADERRVGATLPRRRWQLCLSAGAVLLTLVTAAWLLDRPSTRSDTTGKQHLREADDLWAFLQEGCDRMSMEISDVTLAYRARPLEPVWAAIMTP